MKIGDYVFYSSEYGEAYSGKAVDIFNDEEIELELSDGSRVNPIDLNDCYPISLGLYLYIAHLEKLKNKVIGVAEDCLNMYQEEV